MGRGIKQKGGESTGEECIVFYVVTKVPESKLKREEIIPIRIKGVITDVQVMEPPRGPRPIPKTARKRSVDKTAKHRPCPAGVSIGVYSITAGTQCWYARDLKNETSKLLGLSNNHVKSNENLAPIGADIYQPGSYDGGTSEDVLEHLFRFVPIKFQTESGCPTKVWAGIYNWLSTMLSRKTRLIPVVEAVNEVDAAVGEPVDEDDYALEIVDIGKPQGKNYSPALGDKGMKSGRTTCLTRKAVLADKDWRGSVGYDRGVAIFDHQFVYEHREGEQFSAGGDSGSLVLDHDKNIVGLLFAGSSSHTIVNPIGLVENRLEISLFVP